MLIVIAKGPLLHCSYNSAVLCTATCPTDNEFLHVTHDLAVLQGYLQMFGLLHWMFCAWKVRSLP